MNAPTPAPLDHLAADLVRRGLPVEYAQRAAAELADHHRDLVAELRATGLDEAAASAEASRRLGDSHSLVKKTVRAYQRRYWCGRWRWTMFVFAPIPLLFVAWLGTIALFALFIVWPLDALGFSGPVETFDGIISTKEWAFACLVQAWFLFVVPAATMFGLARFARWAAIDWRWVAASACVLALSVCVASCGFPAAELHHRMTDGSPVPADRFVMTVGLVIPSPSAASRAWYRDQFGRILLPFAVAAVVLIRNRQLALRSEQLVLNGC